MSEFIQDVIARASKQAIEGLLLTLEEPKAPEQMAERYKRDAARILKTKLFQAVIRKIVEDAKDTIAFKAKTSDETQFNRGIAYGMKLLSDEISRYNVLKDYYEDENTLP